MLREIKGKGQRVLILTQVSVLWYHASNNLLLPLFNFGPIYIVMPVMCDTLLVLVSKELASINVFYFLNACIIYFWQLNHAMISLLTCQCYAEVLSTSHMRISFKLSMLFGTFCQMFGNNLGYYFPQSQNQELQKDW